MTKRNLSGNIDSVGGSRIVLKIGTLASALRNASLQGIIEKVFQSSSFSISDDNSNASSSKDS